MKKLLFLLMLPMCASAQYTNDYKTVWKASEMRNYSGDAFMKVLLLTNDYFPNKTGGIYEFCDTCTHADDSITHFASYYNGYPTYPYMWRKVSEAPNMPNMTGQGNKVLGAVGSVPTWMNVSSLFSSLALGITGYNLTATVNTISGSAVVSNTVTLPTGIAPARVPTLVTRPTNGTSWQVSTTQGADVSYSVLVSIASTLLNSSSGNIYLETSPNNSTWTTISQSGISTSGVLATTTNTQTVSGYVPANYYVRIRYVGSGGTNSATYQTGQETTYN